MGIRREGLGNARQDGHFWHYERDLFYLLCVFLIIRAQSLSSTFFWDIGCGSEFLILIFTTKSKISSLVGEKNFKTHFISNFFFKYLNTKIIEKLNTVENLWSTIAGEKNFSFFFKYLTFFIGKSILSGLFFLNANFYFYFDGT